MAFIARWHLTTKIQQEKGRRVVKLLFMAGLFAALGAAQVTTAPDYPVSVQTNVRVKMQDGVSLVADIYRPKVEGRLPVAGYPR